MFKCLIENNFEVKNDWYFTNGLEISHFILIIGKYFHVAQVLYFSQFWKEIQICKKKKKKW